MSRENHSHDPCLEIPVDICRRLAVMRVPVVGLQPLQDQLVQFGALLQELLDADAVIVRKLDSNRLDLVAAYGVPVEHMPECIEASDGIGRHILETRETLSIEDIEKSPISSDYLSRPRKFQFVSYAGTPLVAGDQVLGILGVYSKERRRTFSATDLAVLRHIADNAALVVLNQELYEDIQSESRALLMKEAQQKEELVHLRDDLSQFGSMLSIRLHSRVTSVLETATSLLRAEMETEHARELEHIRQQAEAALQIIEDVRSRSQSAFLRN